MILAFNLSLWQSVSKLISRRVKSVEKIPKLFISHIEAQFGQLAGLVRLFNRLFEIASTNPNRSEDQTDNNYVNALVLV